MKDVFEIRKANESELLSTAKRRIEHFPILKDIYDDDFLTGLIQHKNNYENLLLSLLVIDNPFDTQIILNLFEGIEGNLGLFRSEGDSTILKKKLRQWNTISFESAITELEFAAEYIRKGYQIELEPALPNGRKGDFSASKGTMKLYFEVKTICKEASIEDQAIINELEDRFSRMDEPFILSIDIKESCKPRVTVEISGFIRQKLKEIRETHLDIPYSFSCPENNNPLVTVDVISQVPDNEKGHISGFVFGGGIKGDWSDLRSKIASGVSQLHPDYPGVIIVEPYRLETTQYDIENALFGDLKINLFGELRPFRGGYRIFEKNRNNRLSAVIYYKKGLPKNEKLVYHNRFATTKLSDDIFDGENVTQFH